MKTVILGALASATVASIILAASPRTSAQSATTASAGAQEMTIVGCVQREADYRKAHDSGRGGVAGTGAGVGNEFVLINASRNDAGTAGRPTGTAGTAEAGGMAYELTGPSEGQLASYVGRRVELKGKIKAGEVDASNRPTGGATAGRPPSGVDVTSKDLKLREFEVSSVREASGTCPAQ
jgi:hypothetical protein